MKAVPRAVVSPAITFRGNVRSTRHGWLRLTPAYSVELVQGLILRRSRPDLPVLDPFCGTGTTLTACAELGIDCATVDINPFLRWLAEVKSRAYSAEDLERGRALVRAMGEAASGSQADHWVPPLYQIEKWWDARTLGALARAFAVLRERRGKARDLAALAFCRTLVDAGNVSFRHQSMSFRAREAPPAVAALLEAAFEALAPSALSRWPASARSVVLGDSRQLHEIIQENAFGSVITSPPYVNRMSYIRELRPYMYWLGFLDDGRQAGELDWRAIGGTWGVATSKLSAWQPTEPLDLPRLGRMVTKIAAESSVLGRYVERYFHDMQAHVRSVAKVLVSGGRAHYVVGNSKFFDVVVPAERLFADLFRRNGFVNVRTRVLRRRSSKKELFEYLVSASRA